MKVIRSVGQAVKLVKDLKGKGKSIGFVPTMGALHQGHLSLIRKAVKENDCAAVSIFVNPTQFSPGDDFKEYPRPERKDLALCRKEKVDLVFIPSGKEMYPDGAKTFIEVGKLSKALCGRFRPGHFRGVATVVAKLFNIIQPDNAYFGKKDAQQCAILKKMVQDLNIPVKIKIMPTVRDDDGLALSSRNVYLTQSQRKDALVLSRSLNLARLLIKNGAVDCAGIIKRMRQAINKKKTVKIEYLKIVNPEDLNPIKRISGNYLIALAARVGRTRLIDNILMGK